MKNKNDLIKVQFIEYGFDDVRVNFFRRCGEFNGYRMLYNNSHSLMDRLVSVGFAPSNVIYGDRLSIDFTK